MNTTAAKKVLINSTMQLPRWLKVISFTTLLLLSGCDSLPNNSTDVVPDIEPDIVPETGILIFGDSGFNLNYPRPWDYVRQFTSEEEYREYEKKKWLKDKRSPEQYLAAPLDISPVTGTFVPASGMKKVSNAMKQFCKNTDRCDFGLMLGDNIYPSGATLGADGFDDATRFKDMLTQPFGNLVDDSEDFMTYAVLGNHDWLTSREGGFAQIEFLKNADEFYIDGPFYSVKPPAGKGQIEIFVIDTSMMLATVPIYEAHINDDGSEQISKKLKPPSYFVEPLSAKEKNIPQWLEFALKNSSARWKFVITHHPIWSSKAEKYEETRALRKLILPTLCRYADGIISGHSHTLEVHTDNCEVALGKATKLPLVGIVSGAASRQRPLHTLYMGQQAIKYPEHTTVWAEAMLWGFTHIKVNENFANVTMISVPNGDSDKMSVEFSYQFERRSHLYKE